MKSSKMQKKLSLAECIEEGCEETERMENYSTRVTYISCPEFEKYIEERDEKEICER